MSAVPTNEKRARQSASKASARHSGEGRNPVAVDCAQPADAERQNDDDSFESLPRGWRWTALGAICSKPQYGWTTSAAESGDVKLLRTTDITHGPVDWNAVPFCRDTPPNVERYLLEEGDIVVSRAGSVGFSARVVAPERSVFASYLIRFRPGPDVDGKYLEYFMQSPTYWTQVRGNTAGIAIPNVNASKLEAFKVPLAPFNQQKTIVAEIEKQFTRLDAGVAALRRVQANLKRYRAAVLKAACEGRLVPTEVELARAEGRTYETGEQLLARILADRRKNWHGRGKYKEPIAPDTTNLPPLPDGWAWASVEQIADNFDGRRVPLKAADRDKRPGQYPYYGASGIIDDIDDFLFDGDFLLVAEDGANLLARSTPIAFKASGRFWVNNHAHILQTLGGVPLTYLAIFLNGTNISLLVTGSAQPKLTQAAMNKISVPIPPLAEQIRIVAEVELRLSVIDELEAAVTANIQRATRLRQSILQCAFACQ